MAMTQMQTVVAFNDASELVADPPALREAAERDGYLYLRGLLPRDEVRALCSEIVALAREHGVAHPDATADRALAAEKPATSEHMLPSRPFYEAVLRSRAFHAFAHHPRIMAMFEALFGQDVVPHSRNIARVLFPDTSRFTTPAHQDHTHIHGTANTWTTWIPLMDVPDELGGLAIAAGTHKLGLLPTHSAYGAGGSGCELPDDTVWHWNELEAGDLLAFHSLTAHQGRDNRTTDRLRLSLDYRYQPMDEPIHPRSMEPHMGYLTWEQVYADWPDAAADDWLQYYWQDWPLVWEERETGQAASTG